MLPSYEDIRSLIDREPDWFDGNGTPRYRPFHPRMLGVYDRYAVLVEIACQACHKAFKVGVGETRYDLFPEPHWNTLESLAEGFHYGDPPRHDGCVGYTMNCEDVRVLEAWRSVMRGDAEWERVPDLERPIDQEAA